MQQDSGDDFGLYWGYIGYMLGLYRGLHWDNGKENGSYRVYRGYIRAMFLEAENCDMSRSPLLDLICALLYFQALGFYLGGLYEVIAAVNFPYRFELNIFILGSMPDTRVGVGGWGGNDFPFCTILLLFLECSLE